MGAGDVTDASTGVGCCVHVEAGGVGGADSCAGVGDGDGIGWDGAGGEGCVAGDVGG